MEFPAEMHYAGRVHVKLAYFLSHPIQYQSPLLRQIAQQPDIDLTVFYSSDHSVRGYADQGFGGVQVSWDIPLLDGYAHEFLPGLRKRGTVGLVTPLSYGILSRLRRGKFDAVWLHGYHMANSIHVLVAAKSLGIPVLLRSDSTLSDRTRGRVRLAAKRLFFAFLRQMVSGVFAVGNENAEYWRVSLGNDIPIFPMPYAVDNDSFRMLAQKAAPHREALRCELKLEPGFPIFLFASKLQRRKRCIDLVEAFLQLAPAPGAHPPAYLLIAGDGEERAAIEQRITASKSHNIRMLGFRNQSELPRLFDLCDVFVLPSIHEPWGLVVNEVMNASRPIVLSDQVGCMPDLLREGVNGFAFPAQNVNALSNTLRRFVDQPNLACTMGSRSAEIIREYSFEHDIQGLRQALAALVPGFKA
jgi:glycosyltransferase involved in cell wall biosynthesis